MVFGCSNALKMVQEGGLISKFSNVSDTVSDIADRYKFVPLYSICVKDA